MLPKCCSIRGDMQSLSANADTALLRAGLLTCNLRSIDADTALLLAVFDYQC